MVLEVKGTRPFKVPNMQAFTEFKYFFIEETQTWMLNPVSC